MARMQVHGAASFRFEVAKKEIAEQKMTKEDWLQQYEKAFLVAMSWYEAMLAGGEGWVKTKQGWQQVA